MNTCRNVFSPEQEAKLRAYERWHRALDDCSLRMDCPDAYHEELLRQADEMDRLDVVTWQEWRELRMTADKAYLQAVAGADYHDWQGRMHVHG